MRSHFGVDCTVGSPFQRDGEGLYTVVSNASWVMVTWDPCEQTDATGSITFRQLCWRAVLVKRSLLGISVNR